MLDGVALGSTDARRNSALAIDGDGRPHVAFSDQSPLGYAVRTDAGWKIEDIVQQGDRALGQQVSFGSTRTRSPTSLSSKSPRRPHSQVSSPTSRDREDGLLQDQRGLLDLLERHAEHLEVDARHARATQGREICRGLLR